MEQNQFKLYSRGVEAFKSFMQIIINSYEDGACFFTGDLEMVTFKAANKFEIPGLEVGMPYSKSGVAYKAVQEKRMLNARLARSVYGVRVNIYSGPIWDDNESEVVGVWALALPRMHKILAAFDDFAPIMADLLPEGGVLYITDKEKYIKKQGSKKFDNRAVEVDSPIVEGGVSAEVLKQNKAILKEVDASVGGVPVLAAAYPLLDDDSTEIIGTFGLFLPRQLAMELKNMARSLDRGLVDISASMQQIAASSGEISENQTRLHQEIIRVQELLGKIDDVMNFIKEIADETKILGLNAAIEAARVGAAGMGFGVVAEEIRKLSEESKKTVTRIRELTKDIQTSTNKTAGSSESTLAVVEETSAAIEEINSGIEEITHLADKLNGLAANI